MNPDSLGIAGMNDERRGSLYENPIAFNPTRVQAAAVYCSDGRFGEQVDDLLHKRLRLPRCDRLAVPGGAACLAGHFRTYREEEGVMEQLRFLIDVHQLKRVVLIAHEDCAFYSRRLKVSPLQLETQQREDMQKAVRSVRRITRNLSVEAYFARKQSEQICFERVETC